MPYVETDGYQLWVDERSPMNNADVYRRATETLVRDVERYLYRHTNPGGESNPAYRNEDFLEWAIARFDACKTGSGQGYADQDWDPSLKPMRPIPAAENRVSQATYYDHQITPRGEA
jgi:hypothetical protein